jgi:hypothetical protein
MASDTDFERRLGLGYKRLAAASAAVEAGFVPEAPADPRDKQIAALAAENARLLSANGELVRQVEGLQAKLVATEKERDEFQDFYLSETQTSAQRMPQVEKVPGEPSAGQSNAPISQASAVPCQENRQSAIENQKS